MLESDPSTSEEALINESLMILKYLINDNNDMLANYMNENMFSTTYIMNFGSSKVPEILSHRPPIQCVAAFFGAISCIQYLITKKFIFNYDIKDDIGQPIIAFASAGGSVETIRMLHDLHPQYLFDQKQIYYAARYGNLDAILYLHDFRSIPLNNQTFDELVIAASSGFLPIFKYIIENVNRISDYVAQRVVNAIIEFSQTEIADFFVGKYYEARSSDLAAAIAKCDSVLFNIFLNNIRQTNSPIYGDEIASASIAYGNKTAYEFAKESGFISRPPIFAYNNIKDELNDVVQEVINNYPLEMTFAALNYGIFSHVIFTIEHNLLNQKQLGDLLITALSNPKCDPKVIDLILDGGFEPSDDPALVALSTGYHIRPFINRDCYSKYPSKELFRVSLCSLTSLYYLIQNGKLTKQIYETFPILKKFIYMNQNDYEAIRDFIYEEESDFDEDFIIEDILLNLMKYMDDPPSSFIKCLKEFNGYKCAVILEFGRLISQQYPKTIRDVKFGKEVLSSTRDAYIVSRLFDFFRLPLYGEDFDRFFSDVNIDPEFVKKRIREEKSVREKVRLFLLMNIPFDSFANENFDIDPNIVIDGDYILAHAERLGKAGQMNYLMMNGADANKLSLKTLRPIIIK